MTVDVVCLRPESDFLDVGVPVPGGLRVRFARGQDDVPAGDLATARALLLASVGPRITAEWLDQAAMLRLVQFTGAGVDRLGDSCAHRPEVTVANVPAANSREVAEYVLFATGTLLRGLARADRGVRAGRYAGVRAGLSPQAVRSLHSRAVGVVGLGHIGMAVARLMQAAGATVCYCDPAPADPDGAKQLGLRGLALDDLLGSCDVVTLHVPLLPGTRGLLGESQLRRMPRGALLVNASRGGVVDEDALAAVLIDGHLGGAVVDVYQTEPPGSPLLSLPAEAADRVLLTPHVAGVAYEAARALYSQAWANVSRVLTDGLPPDNQVSP
jgi:phosphoglycerate dehydrogenase-like enzyme